jgi:hypothetical protein
MDAATLAAFLDDLGSIDLAEYGQGYAEELDDNGQASHAVVVRALVDCIRRGNDLLSEAVVAVQTLHAEVHALGGHQ